MTTFKVEPTPDAIDPLTGKPTGEHDALMLCNDGIWDWLGTFESRAAALAEIRTIKSEGAATDAAERHYAAQYTHACGY